MRVDPAEIAAARIAITSKALKRHRLIFLQMGGAWQIIRDDVLGQIGEVQSPERHAEWRDMSLDAPLVVADLDPVAHGAMLGALRESVFELLDRGYSVCIVSKSPRIAFPEVLGSSLLDDSALVCFPVIQKEELHLLEGEFPPAGWKFPPALESVPDHGLFKSVLSELGPGMIAALDHALFEIDRKGLEGLQFLSARETEALRGAALIEVSATGAPELAAPSFGKEIREAIAETVSESVRPDDALGIVTAGLWFIERRIRMAVRRTAITQYGIGWRASCVGGLADEVLRRAQLDSSVVAKTVADLRDPLEWLTLGELMDTVRSERFNNLGMEPAVWRKLQEQLVPVRNRLAHVRMLKSGDPEVVTMWAGLIRARLK